MTKELKARRAHAYLMRLRGGLGWLLARNDVLPLWSRCGRSDLVAPCAGRLSSDEARPMAQRKHEAGPQGTMPRHERTRERIRAVRSHMAGRGLYGGGRPPFGFDVVDDMLVPNVDEQAALERMKAMRRHGATYREIGDAIGKSPTTVQRILTRLAK